MSTNNHQEPELILFSGGLDSTILLESFLKEKRNVYVLYNQLGYHISGQKKLPEQNKAVTSILKYFKEKGYKFEYVNAGLFFDLPQGLTLESDDQYNALMAGVVCRALNIKKIWVGTFTYTDINRMHFFGKNNPLIWYRDGSLDKFIQYGTAEDPSFKDIKYLTPMHKEIPSFLKELDSHLNTKKEAFDSLDPELKTLVRSCYGDLKFCGECYKCQTCIHHKITDEKGNLI